jgi:shikimate 5-dehydrogenase
VVNTVPSEAFARRLASRLPSKTRLFDLNYYRSKTGLDMLLEQGIRSFERWTHRKAPRQAMKDALLREIRKRQSEDPALR